MTPVQEHPAYIEAATLGPAYIDELNAIRSDARLTDLAKAERIEKIWLNYNNKLTELRDRFYRDYQRRLDELTSIVPIGPGIPADTSPADAVVLHSAFNGAYETALADTPEALLERYHRAVRFGDDNAQRAILTVASDTGNHDVLTAWSNSDPAREQMITEASQVHDLLEGRGVASLFAAQVFGTMAQHRAPSELQYLPNLRKLAGL